MSLWNGVWVTIALFEQGRDLEVWGTPSELWRANRIGICWDLNPAALWADSIPLRVVPIPDSLPILPSPARGPGLTSGIVAGNMRP